MKNLFKLSVILVLMAGGFVEAQSIEKNVALIYGGSIPVREGFAKTIEVKSFDEAVQYEGSLAMFLKDYTDDGKNNDQVAGDRIYTSVNVFETDADDKKINENNVFIAQEFMHGEELQNYIESKNSTSKGKIKLGLSGCKIVRLKSGRTLIFEDDCSKVWCITVTGCEFNFGIDIEW